MSRPTTPPWWGFASSNSLLALALLGILLAQNEAFQAPTKPFEGVIAYKVKIKGPQAPTLQENEPPTQMQLFIQGARYLINEFGGAMPTSRLYDPDKDWTFLLDPKHKIAYRFEKYRKKPKNYPASFTGDTARVLGEITYVFHVKKPNEELFYYVSPKYRVDLNAFQGKKRAVAFFLNEGLYGAIPLKMIRKQPSLTIEITATSIKPMALDPESMKIPKDYQIGGYDPRPR